MSDIIVYQSRFKNLIWLIALLAIMLLAYFLAISEWIIGLSKLVSEILLFLVAPVFGFLSLYTFYKVIIKKPLIIIDKEGITDNLSMKSVGLLKWEEIDRIFYNKKGKEEFLGVAPKEPQKVLQKLNFFKRRGLRKKELQSIIFINIPAKILGMTLEEFVVKIQQNYPNIKVHYPFPILRNIQTKTLYAENKKG